MPALLFNGRGRHGLFAASAFVVGGLVAATPATRAGTVTIESQERRVGVSVFIAPPDEDFIDISDWETSTEPGLFEGSASRNSGREDYVAEGSATVRSTLGQGGFRFAGELAFEVEDRGLDPGQAGASASTSARIIFSIDERTDTTWTSTRRRSAAAGRSSSPKRFGR